MKVKAFRRNEAFEYLRKLAQHINSTYPKAKMKVFTGMLGHAYATVYVVIDGEDYSTWQEFVSSASSDDQLMKMRKEKEPELFIEGSVADIMMNSI